MDTVRKDDVQLSDIVTLIGAIGGAAVLALFPEKSDLFGAYGIGLAAGFFMYFLLFDRPRKQGTWFQFLLVYRRAGAKARGDSATHPGRQRHG